MKLMKLRTRRVKETIFLSTKPSWEVAASLMIPVQGQVSLVSQLLKELVPIKLEQVRCKPRSTIEMKRVWIT